jgi:hypothetical protein
LLHTGSDKVSVIERIGREVLKPYESVSKMADGRFPLSDLTIHILQVEKCSVEIPSGGAFV